MKKEITQPLKQFLALLLMAVMGVFVGCAKDSEDTPAPETKYALAVSVIDGGYDATDGSMHGVYTTDFVDGDKIGLYVVKSDGTILSNNVCITYNGTAWTGDAFAGGADAKYFAYYPYQETPSGAPVASATDAGAFFAEIITAWTPGTDQSTLATYGASDLMVGSGSLDERVGDTYGLIFTMGHALSMVIIEMPSTKHTLASDSKYTWTTGAAAANFTGFKPYLSSNGTYRYLVKAAQPGATLAGSYQDTYGQVHDKTWNVNIATGTFTHNKVDGGITAAAATHTLQFGDFYMKDGSLIAKGSTLTDSQQASCIGIVFQTDITRIGDGEKAALAAKGVTTAHGLVMALTNASENCQWGPYIDEPDDQFPSTNMLKLSYRDIDGYNKTKFIVDKIKNGDNTYGAFNAVYTYGTGESAKFAAPTSSTGWFLPGIGQWWDLFLNLGGISDLNNYHNSEGTTGLTYREKVEAVLNSLNSWLTPVSGATTFANETEFFSSSEFSPNNVCSCRFTGSAVLVSTNNSKSARSKARAALAF